VSIQVLPGARGAALGWSRVGRLCLLVELLALLMVLGLAVQPRIANVEHYTGSFDEGVRAEQLLLMEHGYRPFRDIFASQGPLLLDLMYPLYLLFGATLGAARLAVSLLSVLGLLGAWWTVRPLGRPGGVAAAALLALSPSYLDNSRLALAEIPSLAPCLWAAGCAVRWQRGGRPAWLYAAAVLATLGVLIKPMVLPVVVPIALLALLRSPLRWRPVFGAALLGFALAGLVLLLLDARRVFEVLGAYRTGAQHSVGSAASENLVLIAKQLIGREKLGFVLLAAAGVVGGLRFWPRLTVGLALWATAQLGLFLLYTDLSDKHVVYFVPQLALLGGVAAAAAMAAWPGSLSGPRLLALKVTWPLGPGLVALAVYATTMPSLWHDRRELLRDADERARRDYAGTLEQAALMAALTGPGDFVLTDHPLAAFDAGRLVPPWLVDTSGTRVDAGSLTAELAVSEAVHYQPKVVVTWRRRLGKLDGFNRWLADSDYQLIKTYPGSDPSTPLQLYVRAELANEARAFVESGPASR
jgi:hypothetical protein